MRLDHIAYRSKDRNKTAKFFMEALGYRIQAEFDIDFADGSKAKCIAMEPSEKPNTEKLHWTIRQYVGPVIPDNDYMDPKMFAEFHMPPEIFVSDGVPDSMVGRWVEKRDGVGGIHHIAYQVESVEKVMGEWREKGYAEFASEKPLICPGLVRVFTKPSELTGVIYEFVERGARGFCKGSD
jgi:catechol 2,3-dioxygenase-like lactoylglutathione lyase family enzyme